MSQEGIEQLQEAVRKLTHPSVLIVEDDAADSFFLQRELDKFKVHVTVVRSVAEATALLQRQSYTVCLLDLKLPDSPGDPVELVTALSKINPLTPIAVVTGSLHDDTLRQLLEQKVLAVWLKPITIEKLQDVFDHER